MAVYGPMPWKDVSFLVTSSSLIFSSCLKSNSPEIQASVMLRIKATFELAVPMLRICESDNEEMVSDQIQPLQSISRRLKIALPALTESICSMIS